MIMEYNTIVAGRPALQPHMITHLPIRNDNYVITHMVLRCTLYV